MTRLRDIKYLTKNKARALAPIFYVQPGIRCGNNTIIKASYKRLEGSELDTALEREFFLYDDKMFTTEEEAQELVDKFNGRK